MEYVQGQSLTDWCDAHRLGLSDRLELFLQVLEAVRFAHDKQVIHRDLKPSNILVTPSAQVRLLDFGVAKLLEGDDADKTSLTSIYGRALTPDYASPELLRGDPVDVRSDVYSLGVLLYELLTGSRPYRLKSAASMGLLEQAISTLEIKKPSMLQSLPTSADRTFTTDVSARQLHLKRSTESHRSDIRAPQPSRKISNATPREDPSRRYKRESLIACTNSRCVIKRPLQLPRWHSRQLSLQLDTQSIVKPPREQR
jgi:serine/threonine-protein kinase